MNASKHCDELETCPNIHLSSGSAITQQKPIEIDTVHTVLLVYFDCGKLAHGNFHFAHIENKPFPHGWVCMGSLQVQPQLQSTSTKRLNCFWLFLLVSINWQSVEEKLNISIVMDICWPRNFRCHLGVHSTHEKKIDGVYYVLTLSGCLCCNGQSILTRYERL